MMMALEHFNPLSRMNDLVQDLKWDPHLRDEFQTAEDRILASYQLSDEERTAIVARDFRAVFELGLHPYLLSQLARLIYGTGEREGTSEAATAVIRSLLGGDYDRYMAERAT